MNTEREPFPRCSWMTYYTLACPYTSNYHRKSLRNPGKMVLGTSVAGPKVSLATWSTDNVMMSSTPVPVTPCHMTAITMGEPDTGLLVEQQLFLCSPTQSSIVTGRRSCLADKWVQTAFPIECCCEKPWLRSFRFRVGFECPQHL